MPEPKYILQVLRDELALQKRHCKLLESQEQALLSCDVWSASSFHDPGPSPM